MPSAEGPRFACSIYEQRPRACRDYPWADARVLFEECVFVADGRPISVEEAVEREGGADSVEEACQACGRCCYGWENRAGELVPVLRCSHLVQVGGVAPLTTEDRDHALMRKVTRTTPFS
jgi:hypothetical protein